MTTTITPRINPPAPHYSATVTTIMTPRPYAIDHQSDAAGRVIKASKRRVLFRFGFSSSADGRRCAVLEDEHVVTLSWSPTSGKAVLAADGREIHMAGFADTGGAGSGGRKRRLLIGSKFEHRWEMAGRTSTSTPSTNQAQDEEWLTNPMHQIRIVAHATKPRGKGTGRQFDLFVDNVSYFDLPKCDKEGRILGFAGDEEEQGGEARTTNVDGGMTEPSSPGVKGALSQMERGDLQKLLSRIEERKKRGGISSDNGSRPTEREANGAALGDVDQRTSDNTDLAIQPNEEAEQELHRRTAAEEEVEQLQSRLADLSYLPFLEMIAKDDNADVVRRGGAIAEGEIRRLRSELAELETLARETDMGGAVEDARDHQNALVEIVDLKTRIADLEKLVSVEEEDASRAAGADDGPINVSSSSANMASMLLPQDQQHLAQELEDDHAVAGSDNDASFLSFLSIMGEHDEVILRREREAANEKADKLKDLIGNLESLTADD